MKILTYVLTVLLFILLIPGILLLRWMYGDDPEAHDINPSLHFSE